MKIYDKVKTATEVGRAYKSKELIGLVVVMFNDTKVTSILPSDLIEGSKFLGKKVALFSKTGHTYTRI